MSQDTIRTTAVQAPPSIHRIAALRGVSSAQMQVLLAAFAGRATRQGYRVAGLVEIEAERAAGGCRKLALRCLSSGGVFSISQNLGPGSSACNLDSAALAEACDRAERAIASGADLVVLSKFGKQEADRGGLSDAFRAAVAAGLPVLTAVSLVVAEAWHRFAGPLSEYVLADLGSIEAWWSRAKLTPAPLRPARVGIINQAATARRIRLSARGKA